MSYIETETENVEIIDEGIKDTKIDLVDLTSQYTKVKNNAAKATSKLIASATFKGMDGINEIISEGMNEINTFLNNGKKSSIVSATKNKALAIIDPNNSWAGKWLNNTSSKLTTESLKEKTITEIVEKIIKSINEQRDDVMGYMISIVEVRDTLNNDREVYTELLAKAKQLLPTIASDTRDELDTKALISRLTKSLMQVDSTISSKINPLIVSAKIAIQEIDAQLPDIEHDLKYEGSLKVAQQSLADLIGMAKSVKAMTEKAGDSIREDIQNTTIASIQMVKDVMIDTDRLKRIQEQEQKHMQNLNTAMEQTKAEINKNYENISQLHISHIETKEIHNHTLLEHYTIGDK